MEEPGRRPQSVGASASPGQAEVTPALRPLITLLVVLPTSMSWNPLTKLLNVLLVDTSNL
jgi:hypothetical protein